jgi:hypothetical protein
MDGDTVWLSQAQMADLFQTTKQNISLHVNNCFKEGELERSSTVKDYLTVQNEGIREVKRKTILYLKRTKEDAKGRRTNEGFVVFKGGIVSENPTASCPDGIKQLREQYAEKIDSNNVLAEDILFKSPSAAAAFVTYASANGLTMWVNDNGKSLKDIESRI